MCDDVRGLLLTPDDGLGCEDPLAGRRAAAEFKLPAETDLLPANDVLSCKPLGVEAGDCFGVEPADKLSALCREGLLERLALTGLFSGLGNEDGLEGDSTAEPGRLAAPSDGTVGSFLPLPGFMAEVLPLGIL